MSDRPPPVLPWPQASPQQPPAKDFFLSFPYLIDRQATVNLVAGVQRVVLVQGRSITLCINSPGGAPEMAMYAYNIISGLPIPVFTYAVGQVQSAAVPIFMAGTKRYAAPGATFLFHETTLGSATSMSRDHLAGQVKAIHMADDWSRRIVAEKTGKTAATIKSWYRGQTPRTAEFALANGIVHEIRPFAVPADAEFYQIEYKF